MTHAMLAAPGPVGGHCNYDGDQEKRTRFAYGQ